MTLAKPGERVVEVEVPVDLDRAGDVPGVVEQHVLVGLQEHDAVGPTDPPLGDLLGQPLGGHQPLGVGVLGDLRVVSGHEPIVSR
jgi:hypothetical protein